MDGRKLSFHFELTKDIPLTALPRMRYPSTLIASKEMNDTAWIARIKGSKNTKHGVDYLRKEIIELFILRFSPHC